MSRRHSTSAIWQAVHFTMNAWRGSRASWLPRKAAEAHQRAQRIPRREPIEPLEQRVLLSGMPTLIAAPDAANSANTIDLTYVNSGGTSLELEELGSGDLNYHTVTNFTANLSPGAHTFDVTGLQPLNQYNFRLKAVGQNGTVQYASAFQQTSSASSLVALAAPTQLSFIPAQGGPQAGISFQWNAALDPNAANAFTITANSQTDPTLNPFNLAATTQTTTVYAVSYNASNTYSITLSNFAFPAGVYDDSIQISDGISVSPWASIQFSGTASNGTFAVAATQTGGGPITLSWPQQNGVLVYQIYGVSDNNVPDALTTVSAFINPTGDVLQTSLIPNNVHQIFVYAEGFPPVGPSYYSNIVAIAPTVLTQTPTNLLAIPFVNTNGVAEVNLVWDNNSDNEGGYVVQRAIHGSNAWSTIGYTGSDQTSYSDTTVSSTGAYDYQVMAAGYPVLSSGVAATSAPSNTAPAIFTPVALSAAVVSPTEIDLTYSAPSGDPLELEEFVAGDQNYQVISNATVGSAGTYKFTALASTHYSFRLRAGQGTGVQYATAFAHTPAGATTLAAPTGVTTALDSVYWSWNAANDPNQPTQITVNIVGVSDPLTDPFNLNGFSWSTTYSSSMQGMGDGGPVLGNVHQVDIQVNDNKGGVSPWVSVLLGGEYAVQPSTPTGLTDTINMDGSYQFSWSGPVNHPNNYDIFGLTSSNQAVLLGSFYNLNTGSVSASAIQSHNAVEAFVVQTVMFGPLGYSLDSNVVKVGSVATPTAPAHLTATPIVGPGNVAQVSLLWDNSSSNETGFILEREDLSNPTSPQWTAVGSPLAADQTYAVDTPPNAADTYGYQVVATNLGGNSSASATATVSFLPTVTLAPNPAAVEYSPVTLTASAAPAIAGDSLTYTWSVFDNGALTGYTSNNGSITFTPADFDTFSASVAVTDTTVGGSATASTGNIPVAAGSLSTTDVSSSEIDVTYSSAPGEQLELEELGPGDLNYHTVTGFTGDFHPGAHTYAVTNLQSASDYSFRLREYGAGQTQYFAAPGRTSAGAVVSAAPTIISSSPYSIIFSWDPSTDPNGAAGISVTATLIGDLSADPFNFTGGGTRVTERFGVSPSDQSDTFDLQVDSILGAGSYQADIQIKDSSGGLSPYASTQYVSNWGVKPSTPTNLTITAATQSIGGVPTNGYTFAWNGPTGTPPYGSVYTIYGITTSNTDVYLGGSSTLPTQFIAATSIASNVIDAVVVQTIPYNGPGASLYSNIAAIPGIPANSAAAPVAPANLSATTVIVGGVPQVNLAWDNTPNDEIGDVLQREDVTNPTTPQWTNVGSPLAPDQTAVTDTPPSESDTYIYQVYAFNGAGASPFSNQATAAFVPSAPTSVTAAAGSSPLSTVTPTGGSPIVVYSTVRWTENSNVPATGFNVYRSNDGLSGWQLLNTSGPIPINTSSSTQIYYDPDPSEATIPTFYYRVQAVNAFGGSTMSAIAGSATDESAVVEVSATVQTSPLQVTLSWIGSGVAEGYQVLRAPSGSNTWTSLGELPGTATNFIDNTLGLTVGSAYQYEVMRASANSSFQNNGFVSVGIQLPLIQHRGAVIVIVDNTVAPALDTSPGPSQLSPLGQLTQDLIGEGWTVIRHDVSPSDTVESVKALIVADYAADPTNVNSVFLIGDVPVPYSGDIAPDGHRDPKDGTNRPFNHVGAWPADTYYGDIYGTWTDTTVNDTQATFSANYNIPGDGKFDQAVSPRDGTDPAIQLGVGRVDFGDTAADDMPSFAQGNETPLQTQIRLLEQYLAKDHAYRTGQVPVQDEAFVDNNFGTTEPASAAWDSFPSLVGADNITTSRSSNDWFSAPAGGGNYLFGYGSGPGQPTSSSGLATTGSFVNRTAYHVFNMMFGSWFGDFNMQDDLMRAALANSGAGLTVTWGSDPDWNFSAMALGQTIGYSTIASENAGSAPIYMALLGDPTLTMNPVQPVSNVTAVPASGGTGAQVTWTPAADDPSLVGYDIYRSSGGSGPFTLLNATPVTGNSYPDTTAPSGPVVYMVRAVDLVSGASGSYYAGAVGIQSNPLGWDSNNNDVYTLAVSPSNSSLVQLSLNGTVVYSAATMDNPAITFNFTGTNDTLIVDGTNGNPLPPAGIVLNGTAASNQDTLSLIGDGAGNTVTVNSNSINYGGSVISFSDISALSLIPLGDSLSVNSGAISLPAQTAGAGVQTLQIGSLSIAAGASVSVLTAASRSDMTHLSVNSLSISAGGTMNLGGNQLIVQNGNISQIASMLKSGYAGGAWNGTGIDSSAAAANSECALGYAAGADGVVAGLTSGQVEVLYTLYGDADLDGVVTGSDFTILVSNLGKTVSGWDQGDFNYDGLVTGDDLTLLDGNLGHQA